MRPDISVALGPPGRPCQPWKLADRIRTRRPRRESAGPRADRRDERSLRGRSSELPSECGPCQALHKVATKDPDAWRAVFCEPNRVAWARGNEHRSGSCADIDPGEKPSGGDEPDGTRVLFSEPNQAVGRRQAVGSGGRSGDGVLRHLSFGRYRADFVRSEL